MHYSNRLPPWSLCRPLDPNNDARDYSPALIEELVATDTSDYRTFVRQHTQYDHYGWLASDQRVLLPANTNQTVCTMILKSILSEIFSM